MSDELRQFCDENDFEFDKFNSLNLTIDSIKSKSTIVLSEQLGLSTSAERGRLIDAIKSLKAADSAEEVGLYDDPEVVVKGGSDDDDYNEFENGDEKEQKSINEEAFMLRSNFSDAPEDQWDIVKFFDKNETFKAFKPILLLQMQIQNSANYNGNDNMGNQNDQLDHLLDSMLGGPHQNDSSSESDEDIYASQQDSNTFREYISMGSMPSPASLIYDIVLNEYDFEDSKQCIRGGDSDEKSPFAVNISYAQALDYQSSKDDNKEHFMSISLNKNPSNSGDAYKRYKLNLVIVLETSSSMSDTYDNGNQSKQSIANEIICGIMDGLNGEDRFCLISFNDTFNVEQPLDEIQNMNVSDVKQEIGNIESRGGGYDFDEGYNAALGQLQELFDTMVMAAVSGDNDNDEDMDEIENRIVLLTNNLPNYDSSLMDLMQVYSDSDENKIYATFLNIGDMAPSHKLVSNIHKLRGCNIRSYVNNGSEVVSEVCADFEKLINPIFFNVNLSVKQLKTDTIYGYMNNMKRITKLNGMGTVRQIKTVFSDDFNDGLGANEVVTIRLQPPEDDDENESDEIRFEIELLYDDRLGQIGEVKREVVLGMDKERGVSDTSDDTYFDNESVRKRIVLIKYIELLNEWVARDSNSGDTNLNVSDQFKTQFEIFLKYFKRQIGQIGDDAMEREVSVLEQLIGFDDSEQ